MSENEDLVFSARVALLGWHGERIHLSSESSMDVLRRLIGPIKYDVRIDGYALTEGQITALRGLTGPHGWAVYKMLLARGLDNADNK